MVEETTHFFGLLTDEEYKETMATIVVLSILGAITGLASKLVAKAVQKYI